MALKLLPPQFAHDPDRIARFRREATLLAALNHPHIAQIYGVGGTGDTHYLAMELVPGSTLADRLVSGPVDVDESLRMASQICEALEHAHARTIIHRDLKPANVKVTAEGTVKVLDFGLAKAFASGGEDRAVDVNSPTHTSPAMLAVSPTVPGVILGTAAYMSPEQAKGRAVDQRTDIWALGCVLYELLTGRAAFTGDSVTEVLGAILKVDPDWTLLPEATPSAVRALLRRCLRKDARQRPRDAADLRLEIDDARAASAVTVAPRVAMPAPVGMPRRWVVVSAVASILAAAVGATAAWSLRPAPLAPPRPVDRLTIPLPPEASLGVGTADSLAISPDGRRVAFVGRGASGPQLYVRAMDGPEAIPLAGTEGAQSPFFSPDGEWIGFGIPGQLKKVSADGGPPVTLCGLPGALRGGTWSVDDIILLGLSNSPALMKVPAAGGDPVVLTSPEPGESSHRWPQFLPDGKTMIYTVGVGTGTTFDDAMIVAGRQDATDRKILVRGGTHGRYVATGHLVYYRAGTLMAVPFDVQRLDVTGAAVPVVEAVSGDSTSGIARFGVSDSGSLVYYPGSVQSVMQTMVWVNRQGVASPVPAPPRSYRAPRVSPDGRLIAVGIGTDVWLYDLQRDTLTRLTFERSNAGTAANWTLDSKRIVFPSDRGGAINLFWKPVDGSGPEERLTTSQNLQRASTPSPDGRFLMYSEIDPKTGSDLWILPMEGEDRKPRVFLQTPFQESSGQFSPDGRFVGYVSNESGRLEVYVRPFPGPGGKWQVSTDGGAEFTWNPTGKELFYRTGANREKMMVVEYQTEPTFSVGKPRQLFEGRYVANVPTSAGAQYSVSPDGQRFLMTVTPEQPSAALMQINVVLNWFEELKANVPVAR